MVAFPTRRYVAQPVGNPPTGFAVDRELRRIEQELYAYPETMAILQGVPTAMTVGTTKAIVTGYPEAYEGTGFGYAADKVNGTITLPSSGIYDITAHCAGSYTANTQNEAALLFLRNSRTGDLDIGGWPIATNKINGLIMNASVSISLAAGDVLSLGLYATTGLGTFTFTSASFEVTLRVLGR